MKTTRLVLATLIAAALAGSPMAFAVDGSVDTDTATSSRASADAAVPTERLATRYAELAGSTDAAAEVVAGLRAGGDFSFLVDDAELLVANPTQGMGYGEINITLAMAEALVDSGAYPDLATALGDPDGVLQLRADGMGWGEIAQQFDLNLGQLVSAGAGTAGRGAAAANAGIDGIEATAAGAAAAGLAIAADASGGRSEGAARGEGGAGASTAADARLQTGAGGAVAADARVNARVDAGLRGGTSGRPETVGRPVLPERPALLDRPLPIERPLRPERPERGGR